MKPYIISLLLALASLPAFSQEQLPKMVQGSTPQTDQEQYSPVLSQDSINNNHQAQSSKLQAPSEDKAPSSKLQAPNKLDRRRHRARRYWANLIPTQLVVQNAGNMGYLSAGVGWEYGRKGQWETHLLWGFIPKYDGKRAHLTSTLKENYIPWSISFNDRLALEPLEATIYVNTVFGSEFWRSQPGRYPDKYYQALSTRFRLNVGIGHRLTYKFDPEKYVFKAVTFFYEVSSCDLYIRSLFQGTGINYWDTVGLSFGVKFQLL